MKVRKSLALYVGLLAFALAWVVLAAQSVSAAEGVQPGDKAPAFSLQGTDGKTYALESFLKQGKTVVVEWFNPDCPWVKRFHHSDNQSLKAAIEYASSKGVIWLAVNSSAPGKQGHGLERNQQARTEYGMTYPVLLDETGKVGKAYGANTTPQIFIINPKGVVAYMGGVDDTKTDQDQPTVQYLMTALKQYLGGKTVEPAATPHYGCSVKYAD